MPRAVDAREQRDRARVIGPALLEPLERRERGVGLARVQLELGLREQHRGLAVRVRAVREREPFVSPCARALRLCGARREHVAHERRTVRRAAVREQPLGPRGVALDQVLERRAQVLTTAPRAAFERPRAHGARQPYERRDPAHDEIERDEREQQPGHRHLDDVAAQRDQHVAAVLEHEVREQGAEQQGEQGP